MVCGICGSKNHNRRTCPNNTEINTSKKNKTVKQKKTKKGRRKAKKCARYF